MMFQWREYLDLAKALADTASKAAPDGLSAECFRRAAVSRAYYAAFGEALRAATRLAYVPHGDGKDHQAVIDHFARQSIAKSKALGLRLKALRTARNRADYVLRTTPPASGPPEFFVNTDAHLRTIIRDAAQAISDAEVLGV